MSARRRERWYSMEGQRRIHRSALESTKGPRHLISLVVLLALTLIAMRQVSDPKRVGRVASAVGLLPSGKTASDTLSSEQEKVPENAISPQPIHSNEKTDGSQAQEDPKLAATKAWILVSSSPDIESQAQILSRLLDAAPANLVSNLAFEYLIAKSSEIPMMELNENEVKERTAWLGDSKKQILRWTELSESLSRDHSLLTNLWKLFDRLSEPIAEEDLAPPELKDSFKAFQLALDRALLNQFADNTPWRSSDRVPLMRTTQRAVSIGEAVKDGTLVPEALPSVAIPQLMGDTDSLRGRTVRIAGQIALVDQAASLTVADPRISDYGVLWLRPDDGSNQPIIVHVPKSLAIPDEELAKDRSVIVSGIVAKRRAYASNRGGEIAPVVVAAHIQAFDPAAPIAFAGLTEEQRKSASIWQQPLPVKRWTPPADISGALERIEQRIGPRIKPIEALVAEQSLDDPNFVEALACDQAVQATLDGLQRVTDEVQLAADPTGQGRRLKDSRIRECRGLITQVRRVPIEKEPFPGWPWKEVYVCSLEPHPADEPNSSCMIMTQHVPSQWLRTSELRQPVIARGLAFDVANAKAKTLLISPAVQWREEATAASSDSTATVGDSTSYAPTLPAGWTALLKRGWNLDWIDTIEGLQGKPMTARESQAFYSMLGCSKQPFDAAQIAGLETPKGKETANNQTLSVMQSIQRAETRKSKRDAPGQDAASSGYRVKGVAEVRRVQRVDVRNPQEQQWLGADHYYQLDGFADIGNSRITIRYDESVEPIVFEKEFPVTLVALKVPDSLLVDAADAIPGEAQAWYPRTRVSVSGWFYRMWRFKTTQVSEATNNKEAQQGPLLVIDRFDDPPARQVSGASNTSPQWIAITTLAIGIVGGLWILRQVRQELQSGRRKR
ncbi:MAG: hypothetical protein KGQ51_16740 [Planctomycetes bacterium]|nr:hypothetical protein [Planctomycetota bacterium]